MAPTTTSGTSPVQVKKTGYGVYRATSNGDSDTGQAVAEVVNPTDTPAIVAATFTVQDADGKQLAEATTSGDVVAGHRQVILTSPFAMTAGAKVDKVEVALTPMTGTIPSGADTPPAVSNPIVHPAAKTPSVSGRVTSSAKVDLDSVRIGVACLNGDGDIVGGGDHLLDEPLAAGSSNSFETDSAIFTGTPTHCVGDADIDLVPFG